MTQVCIIFPQVSHLTPRFNGLLVLDVNAIDFIHSFTVIDCLLSQFDIGNLAWKLVLKVDIPWIQWFNWELQF